MKLSRLHWVIISVVTAALVVTAPSDNEGDIAKPAKQSSARSTSSLATESKQRASEAGRVELERLVGVEPQQADKKIVGDAFNVTSWFVPPPAPRVVKPIDVVPPPPPAPVAPPLPFTYLGRYGDTATRTVILSKGERVYTVVVGDVIENNYRVEKFTLGMVHLTYLPLNIEQILRTGETL